MNLRHLLPAALAVATVALAADTFNIRPGHWSITTTSNLGGKVVNDTEEECITAKDIRDASLMKGLHDEGDACKASMLKQSATVLAGVIDCKNEYGNSHTEVDYTAASPTSFKGTLKSTMKNAAGTQTLSIAVAAKWLAASCPKED
jgi:hypothetical protein